MNRESVKRYSLAEVAMLAMFALSLAGAGLIVAVRRQIPLSKPARLEGSGLSVPLPAGDDWQKLANWQYEQNHSYVLPANRVYRGRQDARVMWRYYLAAEPVELKRRLELRAIQIRGRLSNCRQIDGPVKMLWGRILAANSEALAALTGYCQLDFNRVLELQVMTADDSSYAQDLFETLVKAIEYEKPPAVERAAAMLGRLGKTEPNELFNTMEEQNDFQVRNADGKVVGYIQQRLRLETGQKNAYLRFEKKTSINLPGLGQNEDVLTGTNPYRAFEWTNSSRSVDAGQRAAKLQYEVGGAIEIENAAGQKTRYWPGQAAISELLTDAAARQLLDEQSGGRIWLDIIDDSGRLLPALAEKIDIKQAGANAPEMAFAVRITFVNGSAMAEEIYFDRDKKVIGGLLLRGKQAVLLWERTENGVTEQQSPDTAVKGPTATNLSLFMKGVNNGRTKL